MYDESIDVVNSREVPSPPDSDLPACKKISGKFNRPTRFTGSGTYDSESDSQSDMERFVSENQIKVSKTPKQMSAEPQERNRETSSGEKTKNGSKNKIVDSSENSDSDSNGYEHNDGAPRGRAGAEGREGRAVEPPGAYDPKKFADLKVSVELDNLFQHILRYTPQKINIDYRLQPFLPDYVPAVGDIDAFIKVKTPCRAAVSAGVPDTLRDKIEHFGLMVLDEPVAHQSDSALLHLQLRALSKTNSSKSTLVTKKIDNAEKNSKAIKQWIRDVSELHLSKPAPTVSYTVRVPHLETLMEEWPESVEEALNDVGFPPASIDCSLVEYVDIISSLFDIPVPERTLNARIQALHVFFTLYNAVKNSQLYADRQKEENS